MADYRYTTAFKSWGPEEPAAIARVIASDRFTMGAEVEAFEHEFAAYHGMAHCIMVNSGSSANLIAVAALKRGKELLAASVPALAWATTYAPLVQHRFLLQLRDCGPDWNAPSVPSRVAWLTVECPILGNPISNPSDATLVDCCESIGARDSRLRLAGTTGLLNTFSFFWSHQLSAIEGGAIMTNDATLARLCRMFRDHGATRSVQKAERFEDEYRFELMGYNLRPLEMHAAIAREQLKKLDDMRAWRVQNFDAFVDEVNGLPLILTRLNGTANPFGIHFMLETKEARSKVAAALRANGVDCRLPTGGSFTKHPYGFPWRDQPTPNADAIHDRGIFLGNSGSDIRDLVRHSASVIRAAL
jgi:CDP-6-deoxy-D-xylo-4-hexulose-3-dehydrase